jgi:hypothetical protein
MGCILGNSKCQNTLTGQVSQLWKKTVEEESQVGLYSGKKHRSKTLTCQVSQLRKKAVEKESQDEAEEGDGEADGVDEVLDHGLHVNLKVKEK